PARYVHSPSIHSFPTRRSSDLFYVNLHSVRHRGASELPYGTQKRVELARALASGPRLLLLDEPAGGLSHDEVERLGTFIRRMSRDRKSTRLNSSHGSISYAVFC